MSMSPVDYKEFRRKAWSIASTLHETIESFAACPRNPAEDIILGHLQDAHFEAIQALAKFYEGMEIPDAGQVGLTPCR